MTHHETQYHQDEDSIVANQVMGGLIAAKQYERERKQLPPSVQEVMMENNFPRVPPTAVAKTLTERECDQLRMSMQDSAAKKAALCIANLREQLTEYHALLDKLSSVTAKYEALQVECRERDTRIQHLEQEVAAMKMGRQEQYPQQQPRQQQPGSCDYEQHCSRRVSYPAAGFLQPLLPATQPAAFGCQLPQQLQQVTASQQTPFFQPGVLPTIKCSSSIQSNASSAFHPMNVAPLEYQASSQGSNFDLFETGRVNVSPSPTSQPFNLSNCGVFNPSLSCNVYSSCSSSGTRPKRSSPQDALSADLQQGWKKLKMLSST